MRELGEEPLGGWGISRLCARVGMSRQNYYATRRLRSRRAIDEELILSLVQRERQVQPRAGARKLLYLLGPDLREANVAMGRDRFYELLARHKLLIVPKPGTPRTTDSRHTLPLFVNLAAGFEPNAPHQLWVSDLTYVRTLEGFVFAALIMDRFSRMIIGAHLGETLETIGCLQALEQALGQLPEGLLPIHHSDRGCQYASHLYVERLQARGLRISMTEQNHCYENAHAERLIGILKQEFEMDAIFRTKRLAAEAFRQAVYIYNYRRPHTSLGYKTPALLHLVA